MFQTSVWCHFSQARRRTLTTEEEFGQCFTSMPAWWMHGRIGAVTVILVRKHEESCVIVILKRRQLNMKCGAAAPSRFVIFCYIYNSFVSVPATIFYCLFVHRQLKLQDWCKVTKKVLKESSEQPYILTPWAFHLIDLNLQMPLGKCLIHAFLKKWYANEPTVTSLPINSQRLLQGLSTR